MVRLRSKPCPARVPDPRDAGGDGGTRARMGADGPTGRRRRAASPAAGECGVKDQVSRTQPDTRTGRRGPRASPTAAWTGRIGCVMSVFTRVLRAGEGKKVRRLAEIVPMINELEPEMEALSDDELRHKTVEFRERLDAGRDARRPAGRGLRRRPRGGLAGPRPAPLRRPADGGHGAALRLDRRDEDRRGQDPRLDPAGVPERPGRPGRPRGHGQRLPGHPGRRVDGPAPPLAGADRRPGRARRRPTPRTSARPTPPTSPTAPTPSSGSTTCATTWPARARPWSSGATSSPSSTRSTRSSSTRPGPRSSSRGRPTRRPSSTTSSPASPARSSATSTTRSTRRSATSSPSSRASRRSRRPSGSTNLYDAVATNYVHQLDQGPRAKELYHRDKDYLVDRRRGEDRRRVHRPHPRGPALVRRPAPGGRGQGAGADQRGEPHLGHGHPPELLPPLREARRA